MLASVRQASDARPSNFKGVGQEPTGYAVTDDPSGATIRAATRTVGHERTGIGGTIPVFSRDWLIACPSESASYRQRTQSRVLSGGRDSHEHDTGRRRYEQ